MRKKLARLFILLSGALILASCSSKTYRNINYLQDVTSDSTWKMTANTGVVIQPKDQLSIVVSSKDPELAASFNLPVASYQAGSEITATSYGNQRLLGYVVDNDGDIDFPILGTIHVAGLNRWELSRLIKGELEDRELLKGAVVTVEFMNFMISVLGEVNSPGSYSVSGDKITILQALSLAKDLTIYGKRDNITVIREQNGKRESYKIDLRSKNLFDSPAYYLQQNDVVYVEPNKVRARQSTLNENNVRSVGFWTSIGSFLTSVANLIIISTRYTK
ncbi:MAG: polysaccharide biosynthesis/export family protein [Bacteroidales bacterium]|nr:polysaccharide biosynthesis/export family protein [Bacteroidales bacterium]